VFTIHVDALEKTKERITQARQLAREQFGSDDPALIAALLQSLAADTICETVRTEVQNLNDCLVACTGQLS
jgi:hypothetical protein